MIKLEHTDVYGFESAIRGMRNPLNSWDKSDSVFHNIDNVAVEDRYKIGEFEIGENDLKLMKSLSKAGSDHSKFLRMINVTCDVIAPLYWWKEFDTYKVGTVANSCSTMHKIAEKKFTMEDFSCEHLISDRHLCYEQDVMIPQDYNSTPKELLYIIIGGLNVYREKYLETKDKKYWWQMIQLLPSSYNQKRTVQLNYQVLKSIYFARRNHKLDEWHDFAVWCETLPYFKEICIQEGDKSE